VITAIILEGTICLVNLTLKVIIKAYLLPRNALLVLYLAFLANFLSITISYKFKSYGALAAPSI
jgi:hypothetical protein